MTLADANKDLNNMFANMRSKPTIFKEKIGHIVKREYTKDKGVHFHSIIIFNGQKVQKESYKAQQIGKYWEQVTKDKGSFHNCHKNKYKESGIGMLDHKDSDKRKILDDKVVSYLCKDEQGIKPISSNKNTRAFTRGIVSKSKTKAGRPRNKQE